MTDVIDFYCPFKTKVELHELADKIRHDYWGDDLPVNIDIIVERLGLDIIPHALPMNIDAFLAINMKEIIINRMRCNDPRWEARLRFSIAHELGHFILHGDIIKKMDFSTFEDYFHFLETQPEDEYRKFEYQANEFGGRLLVPYQRLQAEVNSAVFRLKDLGITAFIKKDPDNILASICPSLCKPFYVSQDCIERRIKNERLWPPKKYC